MTTTQTTDTIIGRQLDLVETAFIQRTDSEEAMVWWRFQVSVLDLMAAS